jgi:sulfotransferase
MKTKANGNSLIFLSGLPRSGSTLLTSILIQNPNIYCESNGNSALCQLMWDMQTSCRTEAAELLAVANKTDRIKYFMSALAAEYYAGVSQPIIIDKCRNWTHSVNLQMILDYLDPNPKIIVTERSLREVVKSWVKVRRDNNHPDPESGILDEYSEPVMRAFRAWQFAKKEGGEKYLFVDYDRLTTEPESVTADIYRFCDWQPFQHDFTNITNPRPNRDECYGNLFGLHDIRPTISKRELDVELSPELEARIAALTD